MGHSATKVLLGTTLSSFKTVDNISGDIPAGKIVRQKSDGTGSIAKADGSALGISIGKSDIPARSSFVRKGSDVPLLLTAAFNPTIGAQVNIDDTTGIAKAAGAGVTAVNAVYTSARRDDAVDEDGNAASIALISFPGGL